LFEKNLCAILFLVHKSIDNIKDGVNMKRILTFTLAMLMLLGLCACSKEEAPAKKPASGRKKPNAK
jgi:hypothetical protein